MPFRRAPLVAIALLLAAESARGQHSASRLDSLDFSGVLFANYQYHADSGVTKGANKFDVERIYLTFRMPVGEHVGVRVTTDIFQTQSSDGAVKGWLVRAKYAYLQYDFGNPGAAGGFARMGIIPTVIIDHEETFWPRFISQVAVDRAALISPADGGVSGLFRLPASKGELYASIANGPGFTSREIDRFKDYSARLSLTPLSGRSDWLKRLTLTAWTYRGAIGSKFAAGGTGQIGAVGSSLPRNRWGALAAVRDSVFAVAAHYGGMNDASETGANSAASPRVVHDSSGRFASIYGSVKPARLLSPASKSPFGVVARYDNVTTNRALDTGYRLYIAGVTADLSSRVSASLDYQLQDPRVGTTLPRSRTYFVHLVANF